jgi:hypothetical protein
MPKKTLENGLDVIRLSQHSFEPGATTPGSKQDEVANRGFARALAVDDERSPAFEIGLAHEELPAAGKLDNDECLGRWR